MILLWGSEADPPLRALADELETRGLPYALLDTDDEGTALARPWSPEREAVVTTPELTVSLDAVSAAYLRPHPAAAHVADGKRDLVATLLAWADTTAATVVNRPAAMTANTSKPLQTTMIARHGFLVPRTLVTTDPALAAAFRAEVGEVVYKSASATRSIVRRLGADRAGDLADVANCPTQFQEYVPGVDVRLHVLGTRTTALRIESDADDYRYAGWEGRGVHAAYYEPPAGIVELTAEMVGRMGLLFAGVDLRLTDRGEWYCLEVNPSPGFTYFERLGGSALAPELASLLAPAG